MATKRTFIEMNDQCEKSEFDPVDISSQDFELRKTVLDLLNVYDDLHPEDDPMSKPLYTYTEMVLMAVMRSPNYCLPIGEIYHYIQNRFSYFREGTSKYWKNAVRHSLSKTKCFGKIGVERMAAKAGIFKRSSFLWSVLPIGLKSFARGDYRPSEQKVGVNKLKLSFGKEEVSSLWLRCQQTLANRLERITSQINIVPKPAKIFEKQTLKPPAGEDHNTTSYVPTNISNPDIDQPTSKRQCIGLSEGHEPSSTQSSPCSLSPTVSFVSVSDRNDSGYVSPSPCQNGVNYLNLPKMNTSYNFYTEGFLPELSPFSVNYLPVIPDLPPLRLTYDEVTPVMPFMSSYLPYYNGHPYVFTGDCVFAGSSV